MSSLRELGENVSVVMVLFHEPGFAVVQGSGGTTSKRPTTAKISPTHGSKVAYLTDATKIRRSVVTSDQALANAFTARSNDASRA